MAGSENGNARIFYRVCRWEELYENSQSRPLKYLRWLASPIMIGTSDYAELMDDPNGMAYYGLWKSFTELAAQCQPRGSLLKEGGTPHLQKSIALTLRCSEDFLQKAIGWFLHLGWLQEVPFTKEGIYSTLETNHDAKGSPQNTKEKIQTSTNNARARDTEWNRRENPPVVPPGGGTATHNSQTDRRYRGRRMQSRTAELAQYIYDEHRKREQEKQQNDAVEQNIAANRGN